MYQTKIAQQMHSKLATAPAAWWDDPSTRTIRARILRAVRQQSRADAAYLRASMIASHAFAKATN